MPNPAPPRTVIAYVVTAHLCLVAAGLLILFEPTAVAASPFHPITLAAAHLITLGWLSCTALGALYFVLPAAFRAPMPCSRLDVVTFVFVVAGASGVVSHMLLSTYNGVAWSGGMLALGFLHVGQKAFRAVHRARMHNAQKLAIAGSLALLVLAAVLGILVAVDRDTPLFPGGHPRAIAAHSHLALVGWLGLLVVGVAHRLLPMILPSSFAIGPRTTWTVALLIFGALALATSWLLFPWPSRIPALATLPILGAVLLFALDVRAMVARGKPKQKDLPRPDPAVLLAFCALGSFLAAALLGTVLLTFDAGIGWVSMYGVFLLLGGFGTLVLGMGLRLWPLLSWLRAMHETTARSLPLPRGPAHLPSMPLQWSATVLWLLAWPFLAAGVGSQVPALVSVGGGTLAAAGLAASIHLVQTLRAARPARP